jgi:hypothetical protein
MTRMMMIVKMLAETELMSQPSFSLQAHRAVSALHSTCISHHNTTALDEGCAICLPGVNAARAKWQECAHIPADWEDPAHRKPGSSTAHEDEFCSMQHASATYLLRSCKREGGSQNQL